MIKNLSVTLIYRLLKSCGKRKGETCIAIVRTFAYNKDKSVQMENSDSEGGLVDYDR